jgi:hypothetical protein
MGKGGGGAPQPSSQTVTQTNLPEYARPYFEDLLKRGQEASQVQYQPYQGERVAGFSPLQQQGFQGIQNLGPSPLTDVGAGLTGLAAQQAYQTGQYQPMQPQQFYQSPQFQGMGLEYLATQAPQLQQFQMGPTPMAEAAQTGAAAPVSGPQLQQFAMGPAERAMTGSFAQPGAAEAYMSPYMQNVVDVQSREARRQADIARTGRQAQATAAGAFGGSRQAIMEAEANRNLAQQLGDIQATGLQSAFQQAQQGFQTDAQRQLQAQLANQQAGLTVGQQNLASALQTQGLGAQTGMQAQLANQQAMQQALMANQQARQQVGLANQQAGLTTQQQNLAALLGVQQLGAQTGLQSQQLNQAAQLQAQQQALGQNQFANQFGQQNAQLAAQYGLAGSQAAEQSRQFGAGLGMQGIQQLLGAGAQLGQLGQTQFGQQAAAAQAQQQAGAAQQAQQQDILNRQYENFMQQTLYPQSQLQFYSSLLRGVPVAPQQTMYQYQPAPSMASQLGGLGLGALGLSRAFGAKDGGEVPGYADGGITGGMDGQPTTLEVSKIKTALLKGADPRSIPPSTALLLALSDPRVEEAIQLRQGAKIQQALDQGRQAPQRPSVLEERMAQLDNAGLAGLEIPEETFAAAGGGIVAFSDGGSSMGAELGDMTLPEPVRKPTPEEVDAIIAARRARGETLGLAQIQDIQSGRLGLPAALPQPAAAPAAPPKPVATAASTQAPAVRPPAAPAPARPAAAPAPTPTPAAKPADAYEKIALQNADAKEEAYRKRMAEKFPSELQERLADLKEQGAQALKERDADRWLAIAMGGFAAAAGQSPYALQNFAQGLGLTTKEIASINKDFRKANEALKKAEREERKADRLEQMGMEDKAYQVRQNAENFNLQAQKANQSFMANMAQTNAYREINKERIASEAATRGEMAESRRLAREDQTNRAREAAGLRRGELYRKALDDAKAENFTYSQLQSKVQSGKATKAEFEQLQKIRRDIEAQVASVMQASGYEAAGGPGGVDMSGINAELARRGVK